MSFLLVRLAPAALLGLTAVACGGDDGGSTALEGIYQLASWTHNPDACNSEGPTSSEESTYSHFFVRHDDFFGTEFVAACRSGSFRRAWSFFASGRRS